MLLPIAVNIPGFDAHRSYDRSYAIGNREYLLPIVVSMPGFDAHRNCYKGGLLQITATSSKLGCHKMRRVTSFPSLCNLLLSYLLYFLWSLLLHTRQ